MEIEVKARIADTVTLLQKLTARGCELGEPVTQDDTVYVHVVGTLEEYLANDVFVRIRVQDDGRVILTAKRPARKGADVLVKIEHETVVSSRDEVLGILGLLGLQEAVHVRKVRRTGHAGPYEVCIDEIEDLGSFVELECFGSVEDAERLQGEMQEFLESIGVEPSARVTRGYDILKIEQSAAISYES